MLRTYSHLASSWTISKIVPQRSRLYETLRFLLDHPRRCFIYLFPSHQTWFLLTVVIALKSVSISACSAISRLTNVQHHRLVFLSCAGHRESCDRVHPSRSASTFGGVAGRCSPRCRFWHCSIVRARTRGQVRFPLLCHPSPFDVEYMHAEYYT